MVSVVLLGIYFILLLFQFYKYCFYRPPNFPPGPPRLPFVGSYLFLLLVNRLHIHKAIQTLCKWYNTKHLGFYIGNTPTIATNDYEGVKELLNNAALTGRPSVYIAKMRDPKLELRGIFFTDGPQWKEQRRFSLRHLRDYGFGRRLESLEQELHDEILSLINTIKNGPTYPHEKKFFAKGNMVLCPVALFPTMGNCFLQVLFGERFNKKDQNELYWAAELGLTFQRAGGDFGRLLSVIPWIRHIFPETSGYNLFKKTNKELHNFMRLLVDKYIETHETNDTRNFIDLYINEMKGSKSAEERGFIYDQLILTSLDFFFPSLTTVGAQISFLLQITLQMPEVKEKIQQEIENIVGNGRLPNLDDRAHMPYTEACIRELLRFETLSPSGLPHTALQPTTFLGYDVPEGTLFIAGLDSMHNDEKLWGDPRNFRPERFLDMRGQLSLKKDVTLPFGSGKRLCAGETFGRNSLFLLTTAILQNFDFELPQGSSETIEELIERNETGMIRTTPDFWLKFIPR